MQANRDQSIVADRTSGMKLNDLATKYDLCRSRIQQIIKEQWFLNEIKRLGQHGDCPEDVKKQLSGAYQWYEDQMRIN